MKNTEITIRKTCEEDIPQILLIYKSARSYMRSIGNVHQWGDSYPSEATLRADMDLDGSYVCVDAEGNIGGTFFFHIGNDPTYAVIEGKWLDKSEYGVIHRIASNGTIKHMLHKVLDFCFTKINTIRIDTHEDNRTMLNGLKEYGFSYCGVIYIASGAKRLAFQKNKQ